MKRVKLVRVVSGDDGTFGVWVVGSVPMAVTCEDPWRNNEVGESCIPKGRYTVRKCSKTAEYGYRPSAKYGDAYCVNDVEGRTTILIHKGNTHADTRGCILLGEEFSFLGGVTAVLASGRAMKEFNRTLAGVDEFELHIIGPTASKGWSW